MIESAARSLHSSRRRWLPLSHEIHGVANGKDKVLRPSRVVGEAPREDWLQIHRAVGSSVYLKGT